MTSKRTVKTIRKERTLSEQDRQWHLWVDKPAGKPHASGAVIRLNSTYLELVDGNYQGRGAMSAWGLFAAGLFAYGIVAIFVSAVRRIYLDGGQEIEDRFSFLVNTTLFLGFEVLCVLGVCLYNRSIGEWFSYTHYPIRLNRKNRMVYVFRGDGTVLEAPWDEIYFTLHEAKKVAGTTWLGISGLVLKDPQTVQEQFMFGFSEVSADDCRNHWEFIRRYMEDGPQAVMHADGMKFCLPIADKKETPYQGWVELLSSMGTYTILRVTLMPFFALFWVGRMFANATCKVPLWPADVEASCRIEPGDMYVRDSSKNPEKEYR